MTIPAEATRPDNGFIDALHVSGPAGEHASKLMLFGQFVGSWDLEWAGTGTLQWAGTGANGEPATATGDLHVGWVRGGRAVQDIWIVPGRGQPGEGQPPSAFHGSTIRFYDPVTGAWRSTWVEPVNGRVRRFTGRPAGGDILLVSDEEDPRLRWRFTDIGPDSFTWQGEASHDGGRTWVLEEQMRATRHRSG